MSMPLDTDAMTITQRRAARKRWTKVAQRQHPITAVIGWRAGKLLVNGGPFHDAPEIPKPRPVEKVETGRGRDDYKYRYRR